MGLLDLPPEILDVIIDLTLPLGIENFALTCKAIYGRATPQIKRHNALKRKWRRAINFASSRHDDTLYILYEISKDPLIAEYIEMLDLWDEREYEEDYDESGFEPDFRADQEVMTKIKETVTGSPFILAGGIDAEDWWERMMAEEEKRVADLPEGPRTAISLLGLLPNLKVLRLSPAWSSFQPWGPRSEERYEGMRAGLSAIVDAANISPNRDGPLSKLEAIIPYMPAGYDEKAGLICVEPFMTLSTLTELYLVSAVAVDDSFTGIPFEWRSSSLTSSLTRLEFASSCINADGISSLVSHTPKLKTFKYSHETKWHGCEHDWNPGAFIEALARHCGNTITDLAITIDELFGEIINGASSFLSFPRLQKLEVDVLIFCGPPLESGQQQGEEAFVPEGARIWAKEDIPCIGSMMPPGIMEVQINTEYPEPDKISLTSLLKNLMSQRAERLYALENVVIRQYCGNSASILVENAGATLDPFDHEIEEEDVRPRSKMPAWKREFEESIRRLERWRGVTNAGTEW